MDAGNDAGLHDAGQGIDASTVEDSGAVVPPDQPLVSRFVDSVLGSDANDGRSTGTPFATLAKLLQSPIAGGEIVYLARGSLFREELTGLPQGSQVRAYGEGERPIIDGSDIAPNATFQKTDGYTSVYQIAWTPAFTDDGGKTAHRVWEDGNRLQRVQDLASCDSTPGSFYAPTPSVGGTDTIYVHASDSSDISGNGKLYELTRRRWAIQLYDYPHQASVYSIHTRRNAHADGSLAVDGLVSDCLAEDGRIHNVFIRGVAEDTTAWKIEPPSVYGGATMFVTYDKVDRPGVIYRRCRAIADADALGPTSGPNKALTLGYYGHTSGGGVKFGTAVYEQCTASGVVQGFGFGDVDNALYYKCSVSGGQIAIGSYPNETLAILGGFYRTAVENSSLLRLNNDYGRPQNIIVRGARLVIESSSRPIWINRTGGTAEISRCTFAQLGGGIFTFDNGTIVVKNNIFYGHDYLVNNSSSSDLHYEADDNLYFEDDVRPTMFQFDSTIINGLPDWRVLTGQDMNSLDADPQFTGSPRLGELGVAPTSPAQALAAGADYEGEEADAVLQAYRESLTAGVQP